MELLLSLGISTKEELRPRYDIEVELGASTRVGELLDALVTWASREGHTLPDDAVLTAVGNDGGRPLASEDSVFDVALISGQQIDIESRDTGTPAAVPAEELIRAPEVSLDVTSGSAAGSGWMAELKRNRAVLMLRPESAGEVEAGTRARPVLRPGQLFPPGRGVLVDHGSTTLIQVRAALEAEVTE